MDKLRNFGSGPRELTCAVDLINNFRSLNHHDFRLKRRFLPSLGRLTVISKRRRRSTGRTGVKDGEKDKEHKKHKHCHKDRNKDKDRVGDKKKNGYDYENNHDKK